MRVGAASGDALPRPGRLESKPRMKGAWKGVRQQRRTSRLANVNGDVGLGSAH